MWVRMKCQYTLVVGLISSFVAYSRVLSQPGNQAYGCPGGYTLFGQNCYHVFRTKANWVEAKSFCDVFGATLLIVNNEPEEAFLLHYLNNTQANYPTTDFWVDGSDLLVEGDWVWSRLGTPLRYTDWTPGDPTNSGGVKNCMTISLHRNATWVDEDCGTMLSFICERESEVVGRFK